jgi:hypothetical protein
MVDDSDVTSVQPLYQKLRSPVKAGNTLNIRGGALYVEGSVRHTTLVTEKRQKVKMTTCLRGAGRIRLEVN